MTHSGRPEDVAASNQRSLATLLRAVTLSQGQFALILVRCNYAALREQMWQELQAACSLRLQSLILAQSVKTLFSTIQAAVVDEPAIALMVFGLESVTSLDQLLVSTNQVRDEFRTHFPFPVVLWVTEEVLASLTRLAPDFKSWAAASIKFELPANELIQLWQQAADTLFPNILEAGIDKFLPNETLDLAPGCRQRQELEAAHRDLQSLGAGLEPEMEATWQFILGRDAYASDQIDQALTHYQQSLAFWQHRSAKLQGQAPIFNSYLDRQGILLFHIGLCYRRKAQLQPAASRSHWEAARDFCFAGVEVFEGQGRSNVVAQLITLAGEVLRHLEAWADLQSLALQSLTRLETYNSPVQVAQAYGFLAEVALKQSKWSEAYQSAQTALSILAPWSSDLPSPLEGLSVPNSEPGGEPNLSLYLLLLAKAERPMEQQLLAVVHLEQAKAEIERKGSILCLPDPQLYLDILEELRSLYFEQRRYLEAFKLKQKQRSIKQQYGFCTFLGASSLQPHRRPAGLTTVSVSQEIAAAGRQQDVQQLIERISRNDYTLIVIHGASGVGKSSLINAGLVPALSGRIMSAREVLPVVQQVYTDWAVSLDRALNEALSLLRRRREDASSYFAASVDGLINRHQPLSDPEAILEKLRAISDRNLLTVLIFDQFEEFFFGCTEIAARQEFYNFFSRCLNLPFVKVILSLREDDLHYLLEYERLTNLDAINNNILDKQIRYSLGNFSITNATEVILNLTERSQFHLEPELIAQLVQDLAGKVGEVRPIELQVVGAQLQAEKIQTLEQYRRLGADPKAALVERSLNDVISDCGQQNEDIVWSILYALTDSKGTRPLKTESELAAAAYGIRENATPSLSLPNSEQALKTQLDLTLQILVGSGLVFRVREEPEDRYQLVHDYLVDPIRQRYNRRIQLNIAAQLARREIELVRVRKQRLRAIAAGITLAILTAATGGFAWRAEAQRRIAAALSTNAEMNAMSAASEALFASNKQFDALLEALRAASRLQREKSKRNNKFCFMPLQDCLLYFAIKPDTELQVVTAYEQAVYGVLERNRLEGHSDVVWDVTYSRDGQMIASASKDRTLRVWRPDGTLLGILAGHEESVTSVAFSPNNQWIASGSWDKTVKIWQPNGQLLRTLRGNLGYIYSVSFSPDGRFIAAALGDGTVKLWTVEGTLVKTWMAHQGVVSWVSFSPDGQSLASVGEDKTIRLWSLTGNLLSTLTGHTGSITGVSFSPDGDLIASSSDDKTVKLWSRVGRSDRSYAAYKTLTGHKTWVFSVRFSPDSQTLASASEDNTIRLWTRKGTLIKVLQGHSDGVTGVSFSPDGQTIASASYDKTVKLWQYNNLSRSTLTGHKDDLYDVTFSPDAEMLASASRDHTVKVWSRTGALLTTLTGHGDRVHGVSFSPDSKIIASASRDKTVKLWRPNGTLLRTLNGHQEWVLDVKFSPDGKRIVSASRDKTLKIWDINGTLIKTLGGHGARVNAVAFSPDGQLLASASDDKTVKIWQADGTLLTTLTGHSGWVLDLNWSPDSQLLASASYDNTVKLWRRTEEPGGTQMTAYTTLKGPTDSVAHVRFSPSGQILATTSWDNRVQLWRLDDTLIKNLEGHSDRVTGVSFSPDGRMLASASNDNTIILWNLDLDDLLARSCDWVHDYLHNNPKVKESDRHLCDRVKPVARR